MTATYNPTGPDYLANPYPTYHRLRAEDPVHWDERGNRWLLTRYADVHYGLRDPRLSRARIAAGMNRLPEELRAEIGPLGEGLATWMCFWEPPDHTRLRAPFFKAFTPRVVERLRPHIEAIAQALLDAVRPAGRMDVVADFAYPLPAIVIAELLGAPPEDRDRFKGWSDDLTLYLGGTPGGGMEAFAQRARRAQQSLLALLDYLRGLIAKRRTEPREDLLSALLATAEGQALTEAELLNNCIFLLAAGHDTTRNLIGMGILALLRHPEQMRRLRENPTSIVSAVEEMLRYDSPVQTQPRIATEDFTIDGRQIHAGQGVVLMLGAANRDPAQFPDPDTFDIGRRENRHVAFGYGPHFCVGASLGRMEAQIAISTLLRRLPDLRLATEAPQWRPMVSFRGLQSLPVTFSP